MRYMMNGRVMGGLIVRFCEGGLLFIIKWGSDVRIVILCMMRGRGILILLGWK